MPKVLSKRDKAIKQKILNAAKVIKQKYLSLKLERSGEDDALNKILNPIKGPLTKIVENTELTKVKAEKEDALKKETKEEKEEDQLYREQDAKEEEKLYREQDVTLKEPKFLTTNVIGELGTDNGSDDDDNVFEEEEPHVEDDDELQKSISDRTAGYLEYINQYPLIAREYIDKHFRNSEEIDLTYGLSHDKTIDKWKMGSELLSFKANGDIKIGKRTYRGTRGLYELIFMKEPMYPTRADEAEYREILNQTNVHRRDNKPSSQIKGSSSVKYKQYIQPLFTAKSEAAKLNKKRVNSAPSKSGSGLLRYTKKPKEYVYYDDVNELVDRLAKLNASQDAGNGNNINEIMSILEELRELDVIEFI